MITGQEKALHDRPDARHEDRSTLAAVGNGTGSVGGDLTPPHGMRVAFEAMTEFVGLLSVDGVLLEANASALAAGGLTSGDVTGRPFWQARWWSYSPTVQDQLRDAVQRAACGETVRYVVDVLAADGGQSLVPIDFRLTPVRDADGAVEFIVPEGRPLTSVHAPGDSHAAVIDELAAARRHSAALAQLTSNLAGAASTEGIAAAVCRDAPAVVGAGFVGVAMVRGGELRCFQPGGTDTGASWVSVSLDSTTAAGEAAVRGEPVHLDAGCTLSPLCPTRQDVEGGEADLVSLEAYPLQWGSPKSVKAVLELGWTNGGRGDAASDVASVVALCAAALERGWTTDELRRTEALLRTLLSEAPIGLGFFDTDLRFQMINDRLAEINGHSVEEHLGKSIADIVPDLEQQAVPLFRSVMSHAEPVTGIEFVGETAAAPGVTRVWEEGLYPVATAEGDVIGIGAVVEEVTERRAAQRELEELARVLQAGLLPQRLARPDGWDVAVRYCASVDRLDVGGDWYEFDEIDDDDHVITIGDVVGHDLRAAIAMSQLRNALAGLGHAYRDPAEILTHLDHYATHTPSCFGTAVFYARLDPHTGTMRYSNAGHLPPLVVTADGAARFIEDPPQAPLGMSIKRNNGNLELGPGDTLICYTDGLVERRHELLDHGLERLAAHAAQTRSDCSAEQLAERLVTELSAAVQEDDVAVLVLKRRTAP